jgi:Complex I intermediate-associated protein 30 (CIA30)
VEDQELTMPALWLLTLASSADLMVADFNSGAKPNNLGGDFGCWIKDPNDPMQGCVESFDAKNRYGQKGYAVRLIYSVASKNPAFGGLWMRLPNLDASRFNALAFRVRGDPAMGYTKVLKVELKDAVDQASDHYVRDVTDQWQDVVIPLRDFQGMANARRLKEFVIVIEDTTATAKQGVIYVDDIRFTMARSQ